MLLGLNVVHDDAQHLGFDGLAARTMRPAVVRLVVRDPVNIDAWIDSAAAHRLKVLWCLPIEDVHPDAAQHAIARILGWTGPKGEVTAGIEIGHTPWSRGMSAQAFADDAGGLALFAVIAGAWANGRARCPIVLGTGYDATLEAWDWTLRVLEIAQDTPRLRNVFSALGVAGTRLGAPLRRRTFAWLASRVEAYEWRLAFTRFGWPIGSPLSRWNQLVENGREVSGASPLRVGWTRTLEREIRNRWIVDGLNAAASDVGASHVFLDPEVPTWGVQRWPLYESRFGRPDPLWLALPQMFAGVTRP